MLATGSPGFNTTDPAGAPPPPVVVVTTTVDVDAGTVVVVTAGFVVDVETTVDVDVDDGTVVVVGPPVVGGRSGRVVVG